MRSDLALTGSTRDAGGYAAIGDYGVIGDGRSVALVAADGAIDWWAVPRLDCTPAFAALLDPSHGGRIELRPVDEIIDIQRRYLPGTNVLETTYTTGGGQIRITDSLNSGNAGALPWTELARRVEGLSGSVRLRFSVSPGTGLGTWQSWVESRQRGPVLHAGDLTFAVRCSEGIALKEGPRAVQAQFAVAAGQRLTLGVVGSQAEPLFLTNVGALDARLDLSVAAWRQWSSQVCWEEPGREQIVRSALALKLLFMSGTGAIAAAATTSLPERVGGTKNWDYRFSWVRDAALTIDAMAALGLQEEVHAAVAWLLRTIAAHAPDLHVMYGLSGDVPTTSRQANVPGYRASRPVMVGNDAAAQVQLGIYGDLFGTVADWVFAGHVLDVGTARQLADLADRCADVWRGEDSGIWELQASQLYTSSKMNCWRALDRAAALAEGGHIAGSGQRWAREAAAVRDWIGEHCWSVRKQAYTFYAGTDDLDASVLLGAGFGFDRGPRMASTIRALRAELGEGPLMYRYSGVDKEEAAFIACSYWLAEALAHVGERSQAAELMSDLQQVAGPLGLLSEMCVPGTGELLGNLPQALSHLALIKAATVLRQQPLQ